jgi:hypothetical protein
MRRAAERSNGVKDWQSGGDGLESISERRHAIWWHFHNIFSFPALSGIGNSVFTFLKGKTMHFTDMRWWQWAIIGLLLGALAGSVRSFYADIPDAGVHETLSQKEFERDLFRKSSDGKSSYFDSLKVVPFENRQIIIGEYTVTAHHRDPKNPKARPTVTHESRRFRMVPTVPYKPGPRFKGDFPKNLTVAEFLGWVQQHHPALNVRYRYNSWDTPKTQFAMWIGGSVLLFGLVWPVTINFLTFGRPWRPKPPKEEYDLDRFGKGEPEPPPPPPPEVDHGAIHSQIAAIEAELEAGTTASTAPAPSSTVEDRPADASVRKLDAGPLEAPSTRDESQEKKDYAGEFYPTTTHVTKKET